VNGIGLLDIETTLLPHKTVSETSAVHAASGLSLRAYEIHLGKTSGPDCQRPFSITPKGPEGANSPNGRVSGTYLHGCFVSDDFRAAVLRDLGIGQSTLDYDHEIETTLDHLAHHVATHLDTDKICALAN
jgi:adenosylcobyric acid synthase